MFLLIKKIICYIYSHPFGGVEVEDDWMEGSWAIEFEDIGVNWLSVMTNAFSDSFSVMRKLFLKFFLCLLILSLSWECFLGLWHSFFLWDSLISQFFSQLAIFPPLWLPSFSLMSTLMSIGNISLNWWANFGWQLSGSQYWGSILIFLRREPILLHSIFLKPFELMDLRSR